MKDLAEIRDDLMQKHGAKEGFKRYLDLVLEAAENVRKREAPKQ